ncbi:NUDIX domain-containing protein [Streptomyces sp. NPDC003753]
MAAGQGRRWKWLTVVGGHLEAGEPLDLAARREAKEEAGVDLAPSGRIPAGGGAALSGRHGGSPPAW